MIQYQLKLRLTKAQKAKRDEWLPILGSIYNFGVRKIELNAKDKIYFTPFDFRNLLAGHSSKLGVPSHCIQGTLQTAYMRCKPRQESQQWEDQPSTPIAPMIMSET